MVGSVGVLHLGAQDIGVVAHSTSDFYLSEVEWPKSSESQDKALIKPTPNNEYTISDTILGMKSSGALYDEGVLVLRWETASDGHLQIQSDTEKQINLHASFKTKKCSIRAQGPLYINGSIESESILEIEAEALWLAQAISSVGSIILNARKGIGLNTLIKTNNLMINAPYVYQAGELQVSGLYEVSAQFFKQDDSARTVTNKLRLRATESEMSGNLTVQEDCYLDSPVLIWGHETQSSTLRFLGDNHIHAGSLRLRADTQVRLGSLNSPKRGLLRVDGHLTLAETALAHLFHTESALHQIDNQGELLLNQCVTDAQWIHQEGIFEANASVIKISEYFTHGNHSSTQFNLCQFSAPITNIYGLNLSFNHTVYKGKSCTVKSGLVAFQNQSDITVDELFLDKNSKALVITSQLDVTQSIQSHGTLRFEHAVVKTPYLRTIEGQLINTSSKITAELTIELSGSTLLNGESFIYGKNLILGGELNIAKAHIEGDILNITSKKARINSLVAISQYLQIQGGAQEDEVVFERCFFKTQLFTGFNHITFDHSNFYGIEKKITHPLHAHLKLKHSKLITDADLRNYLDGQLDLDDHSEMRIHLLHSQGAMNARAQSVVNATLFMAKGRTELFSSLLTAQELTIYNEFNAQAQSSVSVTGPVKITSPAQVTLEHAELKAGSLVNSGTIEVTDSFLNAKNDLHVSAGATLSLAGVSKLDAEDLQVQGTIVLNKPPKAMPLSEPLEFFNTSAPLFPVAEEEPEQQPEANGPQEPASSTALINARRQLKISKTGSIKGDDQLIVETKHLYNQGVMQSSGPLALTGELLTNEGAIQGADLKLGFDYQVRNYGSLSAQSMLINGNFMNLMGQTYARKSLSVAGFYGINAGFIAANNYTNSTFAAVNTGIVVPNFAGTPAAIFNPGNWAPVAKIAATALFPAYGASINLACMTFSMLPFGEKKPDFAPSTRSHTMPFSKIGSELRQSWSLKGAVGNVIHHYKELRTHEIMEEISWLKGLVSMGYSAKSLISSAHSEVGHLATAVHDAYKAQKIPLFDVGAALSHLDYKNFGMNATGAFLGGYYEDSLISLNVGGTLASSTYKRNGLRFNTGVEASAFYHSITDGAFFNSGVSMGSDANFSSWHGYNMGVEAGLHRFSYRAKSTLNTGLLEGHHAFVAIEDLAQEGLLRLHDGFAVLNRVHETPNAATELSDMWVKGSHYDSEGLLKAKNTRLEYRDTIQLESAVTSNVRLKAHDVAFNRAVNHENGLYIESDKLKFANGSEVVGARTADDKLYTSDSGTKQLNPKHVLIVNTIPNQIQITGFRD